MPEGRMMKVIFANAARQDLLEIARYIARDNPARARMVAHDLRARALDLAVHPEAFARINDPVDTGFRRRIAGSYVIVYRLKSGRVEISRVLHAARDISRLIDLPE